jgi:hypothetical protein
MARKPPPKKLYREERYDLDPESNYLNASTTYVNRPANWPGPGEVVHPSGRFKTVYREAVVIWDVEPSTVETPEAWTKRDAYPGRRSRSQGGSFDNIRREP